CSVSARRSIARQVQQPVPEAQAPICHPAPVKPQGVSQDQTPAPLRANTAKSEHDPANGGGGFMDFFSVLGRGRASPCPGDIRRLFFHLKPIYALWRNNYRGRSRSCLATDPFSTGAGMCKIGWVREMDRSGMWTEARRGRARNLPLRRYSGNIAERLI